MTPPELRHDEIDPTKNPRTSARVFRSQYVRAPTR
jgi:hypothetical protein